MVPNDKIKFPNDRYRYLLAAVVVLSAGSAGVTGALLLIGTIRGPLMWITFFGEVGLMLWGGFTRLRQQKANDEYLRKLS